MRQHFQTLQHFTAVQRLRARGDAIEWEELPSLAERLVPTAPRRRGPEHRIYAAWDNTLPADLLSITPTPEVFEQTIDGLETREVTEPDVFRHFFGDLTDL